MANRELSFKPMKMLRVRADLTLGKLADEVGSSASYLSQIENGKKPRVSLDFLLDIVDAFRAKGLPVSGVDDLYEVKEACNES